MKKSTKKMLMAVVIVLIFGASSFAFIISSFGSGQQQQFKPLESSIVEYEVDPFTENVYVQNGFTFVKLYYAEGSQLFYFVDALPEQLVTPTGQQQIIVQKLKAEKDRVVILNRQANEELDNPTEQRIVEILCTTLTVIPTDCILAGYGQNATANATA